MKLETIMEIGVHLIVLFMVIPIHEFAHAWAATKLGDNTPTYQGRLTLNPLAHIDPLGAICMVLTGFGWGRPVEVNPLKFNKYRKGMALTAAAGPISNLIVGLAGMIVYKLVMPFAYSSEGMFWLVLILQYFVIVNVGLAVFNLLPVPPLDGSKILSYFIGPKFDKFMIQYQQYVSIGFIVLIVSGLLDTPLGWLQNGMFWIMDKLTFWVDPIANLIAR